MNTCSSCRYGGQPINSREPCISCYWHTENGTRTKPQWERKREIQVKNYRAHREEEAA